MTATGLGADGYFRWQKEVTYGTPLIAAPTLLPVKGDTLIKNVAENIENANIISSRLLQAPNSGRQLNSGPLVLDLHPTLLGEVLNHAFGAAVSAANGTAFDHTWIQQLTGERIATSFTCEQALGGDLADQFAGCMITSLTFEGDNTGNVQVTGTVVAQSVIEDVARISSFSFPTQIPYNFAFGVLNIDPSGVSPFNQDMNSFTLTLDMGYNPERFKFGSANIKQLTFQTIPIVTFSCNIDADQQFMDYARAHTPADLTLTFTSPEEAASGTVFATVFELPGCRLAPETEIPNGSERASMDLEWQCGYGGTTTGSGGNSVQFEVMHTDATATYTA